MVISNVDPEQSLQVNPARFEGTCTFCFGARSAIFDVIDERSSGHLKTRSGCQPHAVNVIL